MISAFALWEIMRNISVWVALGPGKLWSWVGNGSIWLCANVTGKSTGQMQPFHVPFPNFYAFVISAWLRFSTKCENCCWFFLVGAGKSLIWSWTVLQNVCLLELFIFKWLAVILILFQSPWLSAVSTLLWESRNSLLISGTAFRCCSWKWMCPSSCCLRDQYWSFQCQLRGLDSFCVMVSPEHGITSYGPGWLCTK